MTWTGLYPKNEKASSYEHQMEQIVFFNFSPKCILHIDDAIMDICKSTPVGNHQ